MIWLLLACQQELKSPTVEVSSSEPNVICNDQVNNHLEITGKNFSPLPVGILSEEEGLTPPNLWLQRVQTAYGLDDEEGDSGEIIADADPVMVSLMDTMTWTSDTLLEADIFPSHEVPTGTYSIFVQNPDGQEASAAEAITVIAPPTFVSVDPMKVCVDGREQSFWISGSDFLIGETTPILEVEEANGNFELTPADQDSCVELNGVSESSVCNQLQFIFEDGSLTTGLHQAWLTNPDPAACRTDIPVVIESVNRPHLDEVVANFECVQQSDQEIILNGSDFIVLADGTTPLVSFGSYEARADSAQDCVPLLGEDQGQVCNQLTLNLPEDVQDPGVFSVVVTNPAPVDCESSEEVLLELLPRPELSTVDANLECVDQSDQTIVLTGTGFLVLEDGTTPEAQVGEEVYITVATEESCTLLGGPHGGQSCTEISFTLPQDVQGVGVHNVYVHNPNSSECVSEEDVFLEVVSQPIITGFTDQLECLEQSEQAMHITGASFVQLSDGTVPTVMLGSVEATGVVLSNCTVLTGPAGGEICTDIDFTMPEDGLTIDIHNITVQNPTTLDCISEELVQVETIGRPHVDALDTELSCLDQELQEYTLTGSNFLRTHDLSLPEVAIGTYTTSATSLSDCVDLSGPEGGILCSTLHFQMPVSAVTAGVHNIVVTNPETALCSSEETREIEISAKPVVSSISQDLECVEQADKIFTISGSDFVVLSDGTAPTVLFGSDAIAADSAQNCTPMTGPQGGEVCTELTVTMPQDFQEIGVQEVLVSNAGDQCISEEVVQYELVSQPHLTSISEDLDCIEQADRSFILTGTDFLRNAALETPDVQIGGVSVTIDSVDGCAPLTGPSGGEICTTLNITLPQNTLVTGLHDISVTNPTAVCVTEEAHTLELIAAPTLTEVVESMECLNDEDSEIILLGDDFYLPAEGGYPTVTIDGIEQAVAYAASCASLVDGDSGQICGELYINLTQGQFAAGSLDVQVINSEPAQCSSGTAGLILADSPVLDSYDPLSVCLADADQSITLTGSNLLSNLGQGTLPSVEILGQEFAVDSAVGCAPNALDSNFEDCTSVDFTIPQGSLPAGNHDIALINPAPADCSISLASIEIFDVPVVSGASLELSCIDQDDVDTTIYGSNFLEIDGQWPTVEIGGVQATVNSLGNCITPANSAATQVCTQLDLTISQSSIAGGTHDVVVINPDGAACSSSNALEISVVGAPVVTNVFPSSACYESSDIITVEVEGTSLIQFEDGSYPDIELDGVVYTPHSAAGCVPFSGSTAQLCDSLFIDVDLGDYNSAATLAMQVVNPPSVGCNSNSNFFFELTGPPEVTGVDPIEVCDDGRTVTIFGERFTNTSIVELNGTEVSPVSFIDDQTLEITLPNNFGEDVYDITVRNIDSCEGTGSNLLSVYSTPIAFFVDPEVIYNGVSVQATLYASDINQDITAVVIEEAATGTQTAVSFIYDINDANRVRFVVPAGLPEGDYHVHIEDQLTCGDTLQTAFYMEADVTVDITAVDPAFGTELDYTSVQITSDPASGLDNFQDVPRFYLNPASSSGVAQEVFGINYQSTEQVDALIPPNLPVGFYDVLAINPDGGVGFLASGVEILSEALPLISGVSPGSFDTSHTGELTILGENLDLASVGLTCQDIASGTEVVIGASITSGTSDSYEVVIDMTDPNLTSGLVCIVEVSNNSGASANFSSVSITNPSGNLSSANFFIGEPMDIARRGPSVAVGRATYSARYLYVMGGDAGEKTFAHDSIEFAQVDRYGQMQSWNYLPNTLSEVRSLTKGVTIGRYIYLAGGNDGAFAISSVVRAQVLDPTEAPNVSSIELDFDPSSALVTGTWRYRVSAIYPSSYDDNPGGESLASDPFVVRIPNIGDSLSVTLSWDAAPNATAYKIYRSPTADSASGTEELLGQVSTTEFTDEGDPTDPSGTPLPQGALGAWEYLPDLNFARERACIAKVDHPTDPTKSFIYVAGGLDDNEDALDTIEYLEVTELDEYDHETSVAWTLSAEVLSIPRSECGAYVVDDEINPYLPSSEMYIYFGPGKEDDGTSTGVMDAAQVSTTGELTGMTTVGGDFNRTGYAYGAAGGYFYAFGGARINNNLNPQYYDSSVSAGVCGPDGSGGEICNSALPENQNFNADPINLTSERYILGVAMESSLFFVIGGESGANAALNTVDWVYY